MSTPSRHALISSYKRAPALLTTIGPTTYTLLSNLFALAEITAALTKHFEPTRSVIAERFHFHRRNQTASNSPHSGRLHFFIATSRHSWTKHYLTGSYAQKRDYCLKLTLPWLKEWKLQIATLAH